MNLYYRRANNGRITTTTIAPRQKVSVSDAAFFALAAIASLIGLYAFLVLVLSL
jgi:hypothetical protein